MEPTASTSEFTVTPEYVVTVELEQIMLSVDTVEDEKNSIGPLPQTATSREFSASAVVTSTLLTCTVLSMRPTPLSRNSVSSSVRLPSVSSRIQLTVPVEAAPSD